MVYHEIIDNHKYYSSGKTSSDGINPNIPFLVNCETLEVLASIFVNHGDVERILGLLQYFKRFYSYFSHNLTYKALRTCLVEASATQNRLAETLKYFRELAFAFRGHRNNRNVQKQKTASAITTFAQFKTRRLAIRENISYNHDTSQTSAPEFVQEENAICDTLHIDPFTASEERNVQSLSERNSVIDGTLPVADLPILYELIKAQILAVYLSGGVDRLSALMTLIQSSHFRLNVFIIAALCELEKTSEATLLIQHLLQSYPKSNPLVIVDPSSIALITKTCLQKSKGVMTPREEAEILSLLSVVIRCKRQINFSAKEKKVRRQIVSNIISVFLNCKSVTRDQILHHLDSLNRSHQLNENIELQEESYATFRTFFTNSEFPSIVRSS